jgi:hypothetical protein
MTWVVGIPKQTCVRCHYFTRINYTAICVCQIHKGFITAKGNCKHWKLHDIRLRKIEERKRAWQSLIKESRG